MNELKKTIGFMPAFMTVIGSVIGAGVFFKAAVIYKTTGTMSLGILAWVLAGVITICAGLTVAELAASIPEVGGMVVWIEKTYGKTAAFLLGWAQSIIYFPAMIAALAVIFSTQVLSLLNLDKIWHIPIAFITAASLMFLNFLGGKTGGIIQTVATICKLIPLGAIIIFGLFQENSQPLQLFPIEAGKDISFVGGLGGALLAAMFAYEGWTNVGSMAGEMKNPKKDLPRAIFLGLAVVMAVYVLINIAYLMSLPLDRVAGNQTVASEVAAKLFGGLGGKILTIGILISVYGAINGFTMAGIRIPYAMALSDQIPFKHVWTKLNKSAIPVNSGLLLLVMSGIMMLTGSFDMLTDLLVFVMWFFYTATFFAVIILRKKDPNLERPYKVPLYPIIPIIAILGGMYTLISTLTSQITLALGGIGLTLIGLLFYKELHKKFKK